MLDTLNSCNSSSEEVIIQHLPEVLNAVEKYHSQDPYLLRRVISYVSSLSISKQKQKVVIDVTFEYIFTKDQKSFVDYSEVSSYIKKTMKREKFKLIEDAILYFEKNLLPTKEDYKTLYNIKTSEKSYAFTETF